MAEKRIIFISNVDTGGGMSGGTTIYLNFLSNWNKLGKTFFGSRGTINRLQRENIQNIQYVETDYKDDCNLYSLFGIFQHTLRRMIMGLSSVSKNIPVVQNADYVYSTSDFYPDLLPAFYAKLKNKKIRWIAGYYLFAPSPFSSESPYKGIHRFRGFLYWLMQRPSYFIVRHWADFVFVTSEPDVARFITKARDKSKIIVIQGGVDITESEKYLDSGQVIPTDKRKYDACFVGRFHFQKGVLELVDIWRRVLKKKPDAKLAMIGDGGLEAEVEKKIKKYKLENNIILLGFRIGQEKYEIFKQSKMMVHPATYDSGGMAAAEGMAWKLPAVSFDLLALKTYYPKGMVKTEINNFDQFAENILKLLEDKNFYDKISSEAFSLIREVWDWKKRAEQIYNSVFKNGKTADCPLCQNPGAKKIFHSQNRHGRHLVEKDSEFEVFKCSKCQLIFLDGVKTDEEYYAKYYAKDYYQNFGMPGFLEKMAKLLGRFSLRQKEKLILNNFKDKKDKISILDIGCGSGGFLAGLRKEKFEKTGVEINPEGAQLCRGKGIAVYNQALTDIDFSEKKFDVITMWHVLEHMKNPLEDFQKISQLLSPGGIFIFQTPNTQSMGFRYGRKRWFHLDSPRHLMLYDRKSAKYLCRQSDLRIIKTKNEFYDYPLDLFWSLKDSYFRFLVYLFCPFFKLISEEHLTYVCRKEKKWKVSESKQENGVVLSICIPTYNRSKLLKECLDSIVCQFKDEEICKKTEIIISDNASPDNTEKLVREYMEKYENIRYFKNGYNIGNDNLIVAANYANGSYIWIFADDDLHKKNSIRNIIDSIEKDDPDVIFCNVDMFNEKRKIFGRNMLDVSKDYLFRNKKSFFKFLGGKFYFSIDWYTTLISNFIIKRNIWFDNLQIQNEYSSPLNLHVHSFPLYYTSANPIIKIISTPLILYRQNDIGLGMDSRVGLEIVRNRLLSEHYRNIAKINRKILPGNFIIHISIKKLMRFTTIAYCYFKSIKI